MLILAQASAGPVDPIVIVGQRDDAQQQTVSAAVLGDTDLLDRGVDSLLDLSAAVPGLVALPAGVMATQQFTIRGLYSPVGSPTVGLFLDDAALAVRASAFLGPGDIEALDLAGVDVLRGAQGTAGGASAIGGIVRLRARRASFEPADVQAFGEMADLRGGGAGFHAGVAGGGILVPERAAIRLAASVRREGGYVDRIGGLAANDVNRSTAVAGRASLAVRAGGILIEPTLFVQQRHADDLPLFQEDLGPFRQAFARQQPGRDRIVSAQLSARDRLGSTELALISTVLDRRSRQGVDYSTVFGELVLGGSEPGLPVPGGTLSTIASHQRERSLELRLSSDTGAVTWIAGAFAAGSTLRIAQTVDEPGVATLLLDRLGLTPAELFGVPLIDNRLTFRSDEVNRERRVALFGEARVALIDGVELAAGVRVAHTRYDLFASDQGPYAGRAVPEPRQTRVMDWRILPRLAATWTLAPGQQLVIAGNSGARSGGGNTPVPAAPCAEDLAALGRSEAPPAFRSDTTRTAELGYRAELPREGRVDLTLFRTDWRDVAQQVDLPGCGFGFVDNLGRARLQGFEAEGRVQPAPGLLLHGGLGFVDARFTRTVAAGAAADGVSVSRGDRLPFVPRWSLAGGAAWSRPLSARTDLSLAAFFRRTSDFRRSAGPATIGYVDRTFRGPAVERLDLSATVTTPRVAFRLFVENVTDARPTVFESTDLTPVTRSILRQASIQPRLIGLRATIGGR